MATRWRLGDPVTAPVIPERSIQADIMAYLRLKQYHVVRLNAGALPNARGRPVHMLPAGTPDLLAIKDGRALFVEVKRPGKRPTALQQAMMDTLRTYGARCLVATSVQDLQEAGV